MTHQLRPIRRIGILTGGGDAPGLNAVIRAVVKTAVGVHGWRVLGIEDGFEGLLGAPRAEELTSNDVRGLLPRGGTILGTTNRGHFCRQAGPPSPAYAAAIEEAVTNIRLLELDALIVIGGDGTQTIAGDFLASGVRIVGVPKTIDNDLAGTDLTFGFDTALAIATEACDRLHTTAESHDRIMLLEVMGRTAGWIALHAGIAGGVDAILIPEIPFDYGLVCQAILRRDRLGHRFSIVVVAEGAAPASGSAVYAERAGPGASARFGGIGQVVASELATRSGKDARVVVLGHLQRGGQPTAFDRLLATSFGAHAVRTLAEGGTGLMVALSGLTLTSVPLSEVVGRVKRVPLDSPLLHTARALGIELGAEPDEMRNEE